MLQQDTLISLDALNYKETNCTHNLLLNIKEEQIYQPCSMTTIATYLYNILSQM